MRRRDEWHDRLKQVEREFIAASVAVELIDERLHVDPAYLRSRRIGISDVERMRRRLEGTYLIRMFAVFEAGLRDVWSSCYARTTEPPAAQLIGAVAGKARTLSQHLRDQVHAVRAYRNSLVHGGEAEPVGLQEARRALSRFFSHVPEDW